MSSDSHIFAVYFPPLDNLVSSPQKQSVKLLTIPPPHSKELIHRLTRIIRLRRGEKLILFGNKYAIEVVLENLDTTITCRIIRSSVVQPLQPIINLCIPLLNKSALEQSVYAATVLGVHTIMLIPAIKGKRHTLSPAEQERYTRIMIAAAEQSKQFYLPKIQLVNQWQNLPPSSQLILADGGGASFAQCLATLAKEKPYTIIIGPSGDFTDQEKQVLEKMGALKGALVPTVLRSEDAVMVGLGVMRSILNT